MSEHDDAARFSSTRGQDSSNRQLPGLHELLSPALAGRPQPAARPSSLGDQFARSGHGHLPHIGTFAAPQQPWQSNPAPPRVPDSQPLTRHDMNAMSSALSPYPSMPAPVGLHSAPLSARQPYTAPMPRLPPAGLHEYRASFSVPYAEPPPEDLRRDSARSGSSASLTGTTDCIGQQHFPGRGLCYVYRDGATCPTVIDGEVVNPLWGTTKAGKARKRLAQACLSCREKKIRCEPQFPRCVQCEKSKRECIMPSTHIAIPESTAGVPHHPAAPLHAVEATSPAALTASGPFATSLVRPLTASKRRRSSETVQDVTNYDHSRGISMRPKHTAVSVSGYDERFNGLPAGHENGQKEMLPPHLSHPPPVGPTDPTAWHCDPYEANPEATMSFLDAVFVPALAVYNRMVPQSVLRRWVKQKRAKSPDESMVLYSILALGAAILKDQTAFSKLCMSRAVAAMEASVGRFSFLLAQARIYMTQFAHAQGQEEIASEYNSAAVHVLKVEGLVSEDACTAQDHYAETGVFGMNLHQVAESKRRTLWAGFVADQFATAHTTVVCNFPDGSIYLRHPCSEDDFERGLPSRAPYFEPSIRSSLPRGLPDAESTSRLAHVTNIARLIGDQSCFMFPRLRFTSLSHPGSFAKDYEEHSREADDRLSSWLKTIPPDMLITSLNFRAAMDRSDFALSLSITSLYHVAVIHLARFTKHGTLDRARVDRNIQRASQSALEMLDLAGNLCAFGRDLPEGRSLQRTIPPFLWYSISLAADTVCAGGHFKDLRGLLSTVMNGCTIMGIIGYIWPRAVMLHHLLEKRIADLQEVERNAERVPVGFKMIGERGWRCTTTFGKQVRPEDDIIYGVDDEQFLRAMAR